jgi:hypothetical protein
MATEMRKTGVDAVGDVVSWGAHFCLFYETKEDLLTAPAMTSFLAAWLFVSVGWETVSGLCHGAGF